MATQPDEKSYDVSKVIWVKCPYPVASVGLAQILESEARVHTSGEPPEDPFSVVVFGIGGVEGLSEGLSRIREHDPNVPIIVFGLYLDLATARASLRAGARGFLHAGMQPDQIVRAVRVALQGKIVAPRQLLEYLISYEDGVDLNALSARQREILELVDAGLTNAQIAKKLYLTESTVKQHLRATYKILGVSNRTEAARLLRNND